MFITLEGPEGAGKTTQLRALAGFLRDCGYDVVTTREPGGTPIGDQIRHVLHDTANTAMSPTAEMLLYAASRAQLVAEVIRPALVAGRVVLCDRYADSTLAYQGFGRGLDGDMLATLTAIATGGLRPDLTLLLDLDVVRGLARRRDEGEEMNRLDLKRWSSTAACAMATWPWPRLNRRAGCALTPTGRGTRCRWTCGGRLLNG